MTEKDNFIANLRFCIIESMKSMDEWVSSDDILNYINNNDNLYDIAGNSITAEKIGNNLRILKGMHVVDSQYQRGKGVWILLDTSYQPQPSVKMVVAFPKDVHTALSEASSKRNITKTELIVESVEASLSA